MKETRPQMIKQSSKTTTAHEGGMNVASRGNRGIKKQNGGHGLKRARNMMKSKGHEKDEIAGGATQKSQTERCKGKSGSTGNQKKKERGKTGHDT